MLTVENLTVRLMNKENAYLLKDICFSLNKGDKLGIIGKSGDGKSTLAKALLKIYDKDIYEESGKIFIGGKEINDSSRGKKISLIFQNPNSYLNPLMKVGKQIDEMLIYHNKENKKAAKHKAIEFMKVMGISNAEIIYNYYPHEISGGMQQRICLCIALICNPDIVVLDESLSYLDDSAKHEIIQLINSMHKKYNFTLITISHDFKEIYSICNKIAIMRNGEMIKFRNKDDVILNPTHPNTIELLLDYLRYHINAPEFLCPLMEIETKKVAKITVLSPTHYVRSWYLDKRAIKVHLPINFKKLKEKIYDTIRN